MRNANAPSVKKDAVVKIDRVWTWFSSRLMTEPLLARGGKENSAQVTGDCFESG